MIAKCKCCLRKKDTRLGFCFDCAEMESIIFEAKDMMDKPISIRLEASESMNKLRIILERFGVIKKRNKS